MTRRTDTKNNIHPANGKCTVSTTRPKQIIGRKTAKKDERKNSKKMATTVLYEENLKSRQQRSVIYTI